MTNIVDDNDAYFALRGNCKSCQHPAHCGHSCFDEDCESCTECNCWHCEQEFEKNLNR